MATISYTYIDEYDAPLLHSWQTPEHAACTALYREVFAILKADDEFEHFVFLTGITKFTQISLFSVLNNLFNISFEPQFASICGITEKEISDYFGLEPEEMSKVNGWTIDETHRKLKEYYDGYHFSEDNMVDISYIITSSAPCSTPRQTGSPPSQPTVGPCYMLSARLQCRRVYPTARRRVRGEV